MPYLRGGARERSWSDGSGIEKDRVALVAASSQGLGKAVARGLAPEGAKLALCSRNGAALEATAEEIRRESRADVMALPVDVTDEKQVRAFVDQAKARFGRVDICVTNAGGPPAKPFEATTVDDWRRAIDLNLMSTLFLARDVLPGMKAQGLGQAGDDHVVDGQATGRRADSVELGEGGGGGSGEESVERIRCAQCAGEQCLSRVHGDGSLGGTVVHAGQNVGHGTGGD